MARRVQGTFTVPCYMTDPDGPGGDPPCSPGSRLNLGLQRRAAAERHLDGQLQLHDPLRGADDPCPADDLRPRAPRHRQRGERRRRRRRSATATGSWTAQPMRSGCPNSDLGNTIGILQNMSDFPELADRLQQGMIDGLYLGRLLIHPQGFVSDAGVPGRRHAARSTGANPPVIDTSNLYYNGNSQGAIFGGALTGDRARFHPGVARRRRDELLGPAEPLLRLRPVRARPQPVLPVEA